ncbi:G-protein coupled receptor Mth-like [Plodia interpunctella]|uniref:G-protein coupled receptor Mth-like n=1 Tax=Plodia interpunctella TaxID=58824 RepID=UPI002368CE09|nr:G-protein coupled receptor Mth-like [Plodia interpunctella]
MKEIIFILVICCGVAFSAMPCCLDGSLIYTGGFCGEDKINKVALNCNDGRLVLNDIVLNGDKVSTMDTPGYVFVEDTSQYCIGNMVKSSNRTPAELTRVALVCFEQVSQSDSDLETSGILTIISVFFLLATVVVYGYIPELRDLQGLCYMCMCISMAFGFLCLGSLQLTRWITGALCTTTGFFIYTWMMATFFWMNVICINVYRTVHDAAHLRNTEKKQYFFYSCYAWGGTLLFLTISLITNFVEGNHLKPDFGKGSCWFSGRTETWLFFYGPIAILIAANVGLFIMSSRSLWATTRKYEANKLNIIKYKFLLSLKLFLVMGISWIFEIASFAHGEKHIVWKIMDTFNCLQGFVIFVLLVLLRRRAMRGLAGEHCCLPVTSKLADMLSPHDDSDDQLILADETVEVRLN